MFPDGNLYMLFDSVMATRVVLRAYPQLAIHASITTSILIMTISKRCSTHQCMLFHSVMATRVVLHAYPQRAINQSITSHILLTTICTCCTVTPSHRDTSGSSCLAPSLRLLGRATRLHLWVAKSSCLAVIRIWKVTHSLLLNIHAYAYTCINT